ncbi:MAG: helix-turn-helix domain-containing protein [Oscillospiraceae bacterium]|nr:helix-turn-helix domain-containing protein [Oscillospiraceae bacterium]
MANLCDRLIQLKIEQNLLQKDIAKDIGIALRTYQYYERGQRKPDSEAIIKMCEYFQVSADYLLGLSDIKERR